MMCGEILCLIIYGIKNAFYGSSQTQPQSRRFNAFKLAIPAMFDICGSSLMFVALTMCAASVYQMMRGVIVVITAVMALYFLGKPQYIHHWSSLFTIVLGIFIVGFVNIQASKEASAGDSSA